MVGVEGFELSAPCSQSRCSNLAELHSEMVAGPGIEPGTRAYETLEMPFLYPAAIKLVDDIVYYPLATECVEPYRSTLLVSSAFRFGQG